MIGRHLSPSVAVPLLGTCQFYLFNSRPPELPNHNYKQMKWYVTVQNELSLHTNTWNSLDQAVMRLISIDEMIFLKIWLGNQVI